MTACPWCGCNNGSPTVGGDFVWTCGSWVSSQTPNREQSTYCEIAMLRAENAKLKQLIAEMPRWQKRSEHPENFQDGEQLVVAVPLTVRPTGSGLPWEVHHVDVFADEGHVDLLLPGQDLFPWDWEDIEAWMPLKLLMKQLTSL